MARSDRLARHGVVAFRPEGFAAMMLWFVFALMTAAAIFAVLWPLAFRGGAGRSGTEINVYRDQLAEIERDRAAGLIGEAEAEAARVEVSRRLLASAEAPPAAVSMATWRIRTVAVVALVALPAGAVATYLALGSPRLPGQPLAARTETPNANASIESLIAQVETRLKQNPQDGRGWEVLAPVYLRLGRVNEAVTAWRNAVAFNGESAERQASLGEALVAAGNGVVTAEAKAAFERAAALDPANVKARYFLGLAAEQDGRAAEAAAIWRALLAEAPADAPWAEFVRAALTRTETAMEAGRGMAARLAERLQQDGSDLDGWLRLIRSYMVLGEREKARTAVADARRALGGDAGKLQRLDEFVKGLGLDG